MSYVECLRLIPEYTTRVGACFIRDREEPPSYFWCLADVQLFTLSLTRRLPRLFRVGKEDNTSDSALTSCDAQNSLVERFRRTLSSLGCRLKGSASGLHSASYLWDEVEPRGLFSAHSWKRLFSSKPMGPKVTKSGPCELFADWPIPPYPSDYEWDD